MALTAANSTPVQTQGVAGQPQKPTAAMLLRKPAKKKPEEEQQAAQPPQKPTANMLFRRRT
jgi:hypothetical protein